MEFTLRTRVERNLLQRNLWSKFDRSGSTVNSSKVGKCPYIIKNKKLNIKIVPSKYEDDTD